MMANQCQKTEKKKQLCLHLEKNKKKQAPFSPARDLCVLISKCVPKKSIYMLKKRKKEKKGKVYLMWLVMHPNFFACSIFLLVLPSPTLWLLSMVPQQSLLFFLSCFSLLEIVFCILWVWHVLWMEQCGLLAQMAALGCLSKWVTHLWHLANPKACFSVLVGSCTFFSVCLGLYTPQHSLFAAVTNVTQKVASYINWKKSGTVLGTLGRKVKCWSS